MSESAPFRLNKYMSRTRFEVIILSLHYTNREDFVYNSWLLRMRQMVEVWNMNISDEFNPYWINLLDESNMDWFNKYSPVFMCIGRKPRPFGN